MKNNNALDEALEVMWVSEEDKRHTSCDAVSVKDVAEDLIKNGFCRMEGDNLILTETGRTVAKSIIRRHRLAERLFIDVLQMRQDEIESPACKFEHILSEGVDDAICTLLGHPRYCPHGSPIPQGDCCFAHEKTVGRLIFPITELNIEEDATISYILTKNNPQLDRLISFGIVPGVSVTLTQKEPSFVLRVGETQIALEEKVAKNIFVRRMELDFSNSGENRRKFR